MSKCLSVIHCLIFRLQRFATQLRFPFGAKSWWQTHLFSGPGSLVDIGRLYTHASRQLKVHSTFLQISWWVVEEIRRVVTQEIRLLEPPIKTTDQRKWWTSKWPIRQLSRKLEGRGGLLHQDTTVVNSLFSLTTRCPGIWLQKEI